METSVDLYLAAEPSTGAVTPVRADAARSGVAHADTAHADAPRAKEFGAPAVGAHAARADAVHEVPSRAGADRRGLRPAPSGGLPVDRMVSESVFRGLVDSGSLALASFVDGEVAFASPGFLRLLGLPSADGETATSWCRRLHPADRERVAALLRDAIDHGKALAADCLIPQPGGEAIKAHLAGYPAGPLSRAVFTLLLHVDVQSWTAPPEPRLPGPARLVFAIGRSDVLDRAGDLLVHAWLASETLAVMAVGLHGTADCGEDARVRAERQLFACLRPCLRDADVIGRDGDGGVLIAIANLGGACSAGIVAGRLIDTVMQERMAGGEDAPLAVNIGIALFPDDDPQLSGLLSHAGAALGFARQQGANRYSLAETSLNRTLQRPKARAQDAPKVGFADIDVHHGRVLEALRAATLDAAAGADPQAMLATMDRLRDALIAEFSFEDTVMDANPSGCSQAHRNEHERALRNIDCLLRADAHQAIALTIQFLCDWLPGHVREFDSALVATTYRPLW